ncbi:MAG TPA: dienelactone hydrolase family protein [Puia sp.]|jgi:predicted peptidase|nr:dienelactone hydrolase family protein [Puia sp.]
MKKIAFLFLLVVFTFGAKAQYRNLYEKKEFIQKGDTLRYRVLFPLDFRARRKYPVVLVLHGSGERGNDNEAQLSWGADLFADPANRNKFPAIVVFPQCPKESFWVTLSRTNAKDSLGGFRFATDQPPTTPLLLVMELMKSMVDHGEANPNQMYVGGLSMGGFGTFEILWRLPHFFAAAFPICGGGSPEKVDLYAKKFPIWVFHGGSDPVVPVGNSRLMVKALKDSGAMVKYSEYPGVGHDSWKNAFAEPELLSWIFAQYKK